MKKIVVILLLMLVFSFSATAEESAYSGIYEASGAEKIAESAGDEMREFSVADYYGI